MALIAGVVDGADSVGIDGESVGLGVVTFFDFYFFNGVSSACALREYRLQVHDLREQAQRRWELNLWCVTSNEVWFSFEIVLSKYKLYLQMGLPDGSDAAAGTGAESEEAVTPETGAASVVCIHCGFVLVLECFCPHMAFAVVFTRWLRCSSSGNGR